MSTYFVLSFLVVFLMAADVASGSALAIAEHRFSSSVMRSGFWRKIAEIAALFGLIAAELFVKHSGVDIAVPFGFIGGAGYIAVQELGSIVENLRRTAGDEDKDETEEGGI